MELAPTGWLSILRVVAVGTALLLVPGWILQSLILQTRRMPVLARIPISFALSVGTVAVLGVVAFCLGGDLKTMQALFLFLLTGLLLVWARQVQRGHISTFSYFRWPREELWPNLLVLLFAISCAVLAVYEGGWLSHTADGFYHLAAIRRQIDVGTLLPQGGFYAWEQVPTALDSITGTWHLMLSLFSLWAGSDIIWIWWYLPVFIAPMLVLAFYSLGRVLFSQPWVALLGTLVQFVLYDKLDFRTSVYPNQAGYILLWTAWMLTLLYLESGGVQELALAGMLAIVMVSWHLLVAEFFFVSLGMYFIIRLAVVLISRKPWRNDTDLLRLLNALVPVVVVGIPFLFFRAFRGNLVASMERWLSISPRTTLRSSFNLGYGFSIIGPVQLYKVDPRWRFAPFRFAVWLFTYLVSLFLLSDCLKLRRFALFLFATVLIIPLVLLNPFLITFLQGKAVDVGIIRLVLLPPYGLILGWFFWEHIGNWLRRLSALSTVSDWWQGTVWVSILGLIAGGVVLGLMGYVLARQGIDNLVDLYDPNSVHVYSLAATHRQMRRTDQPPFKFLMQHSAPDSVVASDPESGYYLGGLTGRPVIAVPGGHFPPAVGPSHWTRLRDSLDVLDPAVEMSRTLQLLDKYDACLVWVDSRVEGLEAVASRLKFEGQPDLFERIYEDGEVSIYHYRMSEMDCIL